MLPVMPPNLNPVFPFHHVPMQSWSQVNVSQVLWGARGELQRGHPHAFCKLQSTREERSPSWGSQSLTSFMKTPPATGTMGFAPHLPAGLGPTGKCLVPCTGNTLEQARCSNYCCTGRRINTHYLNNSLNNN